MKVKALFSRSAIGLSAVEDRRLIYAQSSVIYRDTANERAGYGLAPGLARAATSSDSTYSTSFSRLGAPSILLPLTKITGLPRSPRLSPAEGLHESHFSTGSGNGSTSRATTSRPYTRPSANTTRLSRDSKRHSPRVTKRSA